MVLFVKRACIEVVGFIVPSWDVVLAILLELDHPYNFLLMVSVAEMIADDTELCILY